MFPELICLYKGNSFGFLQSLFPLYLTTYKKDLKTSHHCQLLSWHLLQCNPNWKIYDCRSQSNTFIYFSWDPHNIRKRISIVVNAELKSLFPIGKSSISSRNIFSDSFLCFHHLFFSGVQSTHCAGHKVIQNYFNPNGKFCKLSGMTLV